MDEIRKVNDPNYTTDTDVFFYTPRFYALDNFSSFAVKIWGLTFPSVEHAYQWKKYERSRPDLAEEILKATSAYATKKIADDNKEAVHQSWHDEKLQHMELILRAKLAQHDKMRRLLLETGNRTLYENSPTDPFWGVGPDGNGENHMGKIWMKLRDELNTKN